MTTIYDLQTAIMDALRNDVFPKLALQGKKEIKVFRQYLPQTTEFEDEDEDGKLFPCAVVKFEGSKIVDAKTPQITTITTAVAVKDEAEDLSGTGTLLIILERIRDYFTSNGGIHGSFTMTYPLETYVDEELNAPYFVGAVITRWKNEYLPYADTEKYL